MTQAKAAASATPVTIEAMSERRRALGPGTS